MPKNVLDKLGNVICLAVKESVCIPIVIGMVPTIRNQSIDLAIVVSILKFHIKKKKSEKNKKFVRKENAFSVVTHIIPGVIFGSVYQNYGFLQK